MRIRKIVSSILILGLNLGRLFAADPGLFASADGDSVIWDFENGNSHGFTLRCVIAATPAPDDPDTAGDESLTGVWGDDGLPTAGVAWSIGPPDMYNYQYPAVSEGCHVVGDILEYGSCNDPFGAAVGDMPYDFTNDRGQSGYLGTYHLNQWGDGLNSETNDQIATSSPVLLNAGAQLTVWAVGNTTASWAGTRIAPEPEPDPADGYVTGSGGIAVLSAEDGSLLASLLVAAEGCNGKTPKSFNLDLSAFAGRQVIIEVVDAISGGWGWLMIDEIRISNATAVNTGVGNQVIDPDGIRVSQNYPNPFNPSTSIEFRIPAESRVKVTVYNSLGQPVAILLDRFIGKGTHRVTFNAADFATGVYYCHIDADGFAQVKKMMLIR